MTIQVLVSTNDPQRQVVGVGPFEPGYDPGPDGYSIYVVADSQQEALLAPTAYLCTDLATVGPTPC